MQINNFVRRYVAARSSFSVLGDFMLGLELDGADLQEIERLLKVVESSRKTDNEKIAMKNYILKESSYSTKLEKITNANK